MSEPPHGDARGLEHVWLFERSRTEDAHDLLDHLLAAAASIEAALLVAAERVSYDVDEAPVAVRARLVRLIAAGCELRTRSLLAIERPRDGDAVAVAFARIASRMTDASWKPPVQMMGTVTAALIAFESGSTSPRWADPSGCGSSHCSGTAAAVVCCGKRR